MTKLLQRLVLVKEGEVAALLWSAGYFFCLLFGYYLLRPFRDEMGIRGDLDKLPWLWTGTTAAMLLAAPLFAFLVSRLPRRRFIPIVYHFFALNLILFYVLFQIFPVKESIGIGYAFYIWLSVFNLFAVSVFWGFMADIFRTEQSKRLFGAIGVGGTLGAICGSAVPAALVRGVPVGTLSIQIEPVTLLLVSAVFMQLAVLCVRQLVRIFRLGENREIPTKCREYGYPTAGLPAGPAGVTCPECGATARLQPPTPEPGRGVLTGLILIARSPYLLTLCAYMLMFTITSTFLWFEQARITKANFTVPSERISYLATIDLLVNILALCTQLFITGRLLTRLGVVAGLVLLPIVTLGGFAWLAAAPVPLTLMIVQVSRRGLHYAVDRPTREVLYTVLGPEEKYKSKSFIDTFVYRGGDLAGAWADLWLGKAGVMIAGVAMGIAAVWMTAGAALGAMQKSKARAAEPPRPGAAPPVAGR